VNNAKQLIEMLERDRIDLIAVNHSAGWDIIKRLHTDNATQFDTLDHWCPVKKCKPCKLLICGSTASFSEREQAHIL
jgi:hypothetical protein